MCCCWVCYPLSTSRPGAFDLNDKCLRMSKRSFFVRLVPCRCLRGEEEAVTSLDYSHCSLETVPKEIFSFEKTLQELFLDANQIEDLPKQLFNCQLLQRLSMPDNDVTVLPPGVANLINLRELDVSKNSIQEFPENIKNCKVLTIVEASVNPISKLPDGFTQLMSLSQLYLNDAFLEFLPASFGRLTKLQILELRENQLKMLPKSMQKLTQLERLDLGSNEFTEVPEVLEQLTGIKELWMDGNRLTFLPGMLGTLKQLLYLDVSKNNLEMVDEQICGCESLQDLLLSNNALTQLPGSIGSLKKLTALKVDENQLIELPDSIGGLTSLDELDCSFNEIEALPPSIGQCAAMRTFAADHNFLSQLPPEMGNWKNATVLFLHSNKLESLPEEMGNMHKLKVINLSNNKLRNLPYSFTKLSQMTAMWLSENQSKPLIPLQKEEDPEAQKTVLTNYMFPQQTRTDDYIPNSDSESFNPALWEEQRKHRAQVAFECDEDKDERETPPKEGNLKRYPTPYPDELKNMVKTAQSVAHRLKEDESSEESGRDSKPPAERNHIGVQDVGVKVIEAPCPNGLVPDLAVKACNTTFTIPNIPEVASRDTESESFSSQQAPLKSSESSTINHEDTLEDSEELSDEEEMKIAEMRPPLIEISINQPKVVMLSKDKKDDSKDADSLLDDTVANSNQNNSNCSSPSRMSDSVSLTTDSSQDNSLCTPEREAKMPFLPKSRHEDENMNPSKDAGGLLHNGNGSETSLQALLRAQRGPTEPAGDYDLTMEARLAFIEKGLNNGLGGGYNKWDQINMNVSHLPTDNMVEPHNGSVGREQMDGKCGFDNHHFQNGNQQVSDGSSGGGEMSHSTEELSPERRCHPSQVSKSQSVSNIEAGGMKMYSFDGDTVAEGGVAGGPAPALTAQGQNIVRSKSASLLDDHNLHVYPSSDLLSSAKPPTSTGRYPVPSSGTTGASPPQYNVQYSSKDAMWTQRTPMPPEHQGYLLPAAHSLANTNYSNRNQAPPYPMPPQQRGPPLGSKIPGDMWAKERLQSTSNQPGGGTLQRQSSTTSTASVGEPRRMQLPEGDYLTYRDIHAPARGPLAMSQAAQRPISTRTYSIDIAAPARPPGARPQPHELPERTMSVSDFHYPHGSPSKRPNVRVKSEHSLLDGPDLVSGAPGRVPADWRDQVMRHIEAKKMEKDDVFAPPGQQSYTMDSRRKVPLMNGQVVSSARPHAGQTSMARHPSREQLIDYLMLKVSQQAPPGPPRPPHEMHVKVEKNPELGFSISGGVGGRGNPFRPDDNGIFVTRVQPEGPASKILQPGDKIIQANGYSFVNIDHGNAVALLKTFPSTVDLTIVRDVQA
ncbi:erbin isoform X3 [Vanacampus margaritifer]